MNAPFLRRALPLVALFCTVALQLTAQRLPVPERIDATPSVQLPSLPFSSPTFLQSLASIAAAPPLNSIVHAMAQGNGEMYVGGEFTLAGTAVAGYVVRWDGTQWKTLGNFPEGTDGPVETLLVDGDKVYVGGDFTQAGSSRTRNIAVWDRTTNTWSGFAGGVGGTLHSGVNAIALHDGQLYVGGSFIAAGTTVAANIARWDGRRWHRVGTGINNTVNTLHIEGNYLYAGGEFTLAGDVPAQGIARYNLLTGVWESAGIDISGSVNALAADEQYLYVGGVFDSINGREVNNIVQINKQTGVWSPMYRGIIGYNYVTGGVPKTKAVEKILVQEGKVYVGGTLSQVYIRSGNDDVLAGLTGFARWNGQHWSNLEFASHPSFWPITFPIGGLRKRQVAPPNVYTLLPYANGRIIIGGDFEYASGREALYLALFSTTDSTYSPLEGKTIRKGDGSGVATQFKESQDITSAVDRSESIQRQDLFRAASGSEIADSSLPYSNIDPVPDDQYWKPVETYASNDNGVLALAADENEVYAGGTFLHMFGVEANGIAVYRNNRWWGLNDGNTIGVNGYVYSIVVNGPKVYVAGQFSKAGGIDANNIAVWDRATQKWSTLGSGIGGDGTTPPFISEIFVRGGEIYVGGNFTTAGGAPANNIAKWSGTGWTALGNGIDGTVNALTFYKGNLYAGGSFTRAGEVSSSAIAYWDGQTWRGMEGGLNGHVNDIIPYTWIGNNDTTLAIGGEFTRDVGAGVPARNLLWWNGTEWVTHESFIPSGGEEGPLVDVHGEVRKMMIVGHDLYVVGAFDNATPRGTGTMSALLSNVAFHNYWNFLGTALTPMWHGLRGGLNGNANAIAISGDKIFFGGDFNRTGSGISADRVAIWSLSELDWIWGGNPTALAPVEALAMHKNSLYAAGSFTSQEIGLFNITNHLVRLTQVGWELAGGPIQGTPFALASAPGDELVAGGSIISTDQSISINVAGWNSTRNDWSPLTPGSGVASLNTISFVSAVAADDRHVYVGGSFSIADTFVVRNVALWNRASQTWQPLGNGLNGTVYALALHSDGTLYAGGSFNMSAGTPANHIARWDGAEWQPVGGGINGTVFSLAIENNALYAGGRFDSAGNAAALNIARFDIAAQEWTPLGDGLTADFQPYVSALTINNGAVFAAGKFDHSGLDSMRNIARWNPKGWWMSLGSGTDRIVNALAPDPATGSLYAGGHFFTAGTKDIHYVGMWTNLTLSVETKGRSVAGPLLRGGEPNPFHAGATIHLHIPVGEERNGVRLELFDATGRNLRSLVNGTLHAGDHTIDVNGNDLPAGVYILRLQAGEQTESVKLVKW